MAKKKKKPDFSKPKEEPKKSVSVVLLKSELIATPKYEHLKPDS